ncbi:MAG: hypothetical protein HY461_01510 [Parcubacteria group bacterium]|nr:hypothetical protein [Parcubacteria group bacterium]
MTKRRGQSLIETTIALGVLITGLAGAITLISFSLRSSGGSLNRLVALHLASEGIEAAANRRDSNYLAGNTFNVGLNGGVDQNAIAVFDPESGSWTFDFAPNGLGEDAAVLFRQGGLYRQSVLPPPGTSTLFRRLLILDNSVADQVRVVSTVQWVEGRNTKQVRTERILYNWR